ncbi:MAG TPA: flagellar biosynthesis protein FlhB [Blastocatellia bacterium]|nr:flagellar biosynthesis protein FlhB [Blastocatellia bacterium]
MANQQRTEKATPKRRRDSRRKGQVARSRELPAASVFLGSVAALSIFGHSMLVNFQTMVHRTLSQSYHDAGTIHGVETLFSQVIKDSLWLMAPLMITAVLIAALANVGQGGLALSFDPLKPKFKQLNPAENLKKIFSKNGIFELGKSIAKFAVVGYLVYITISASLPALNQASVVSVGETFSAFSALVFKLAYRTGGFLLLVAAGDFAFQRYRFEDQLKMSKQEVKDEFKEAEGNPQIKGRIRRIQRSMARRRMIADVATADVVITNPTHFAVALSYKRNEMAAPVVVAKGADHMAAKIREVAKQNEVMLVENPPLARSLFKAVEVGQAIPSELYQAVAEVLAFVYKAKQAGAS